MDNLNTNINFEEQRQQLLSIRKEIKLLAQQVDYLIRNEKPLGLLDVDVLMNRTHTLYDMLCAIETDQQDNFTEEDFDEDMVNVLASAVVGNVEHNTDTDHDTDHDTDTDQDQTNQQINTSTNQQLEPEIVAPEVIEPEIVEPKEVEPEVIETPVVEEEPQEHGPVDDYLYVMEQEEEKEKVVSDPIFEIITPSGDDTIEEEEEEPEEEPEPVIDFPAENSFDQPEEPLIINEEPENTPVDNQPSLFDVVEPEPEPEPVQFVQPEQPEQIEQPEQPEQVEPTVLGEKMITEDNSLAAKLQNRPVGDLKSAIGINDKFLFVNELFGGSMEKYNRSIENLNDIQTYNGALIYLDELKVELQWNSNNVAYKKLADLVRLKFD